MKAVKSTRIRKPAMTPEELKGLRLEMRYDLASLSYLLVIPYRTLQDYEAGKRGIPASFAEKMKAAHKADRDYMRRAARRLDKEFTRMYPRGFLPEKINNHDEDFC
jgi:hypothetical protein